MVKRLLSDTTLVGRKRRSRIGLLAAVLMLPALLGAMGCFGLDAPIGNPEKSRVDPALTGVWTTDFLPDDGVWVWILEPYDRRGWLVSWLILGIPGQTDKSSTETKKEFTSVHKALRDDLLDLEQVGFNKAWLTEISGHHFMIFEPKLQIGMDPPMQPDFWWTMRIHLQHENRIKVEFINPEHDGFDQAMERFSDSIPREQLGKLFERVIRKNLDDPELFVGEDHAPGYLRRLAAEDYRHLERILQRSKISTEIR